MAFKLFPKNKIKSDGKNVDRYSLLKKRNKKYIELKKREIETKKELKIRQKRILDKVRTKKQEKIDEDKQKVKELEKNLKDTRLKKMRSIREKLQNDIKMREKAIEIAQKLKEKRDAIKSTADEKREKTHHEENQKRKENAFISLKMKPSVKQPTKEVEEKKGPYLALKLKPKNFAELQKAKHERLMIKVHKNTPFHAHGKWRVPMRRCRLMNGQRIIYPATAINDMKFRALCSWHPTPATTPAPRLAVETIGIDIVLFLLLIYECLYILILFTASTI